MDQTPNEELMVFRRRRDIDDVADDDLTDESQDIADEAGDLGNEVEDDVDAEDGIEIDAHGDVVRHEAYAVVVPPRPTGPWDLHDLPKTDEVPRIDLGGLHIPVPDGLEVRVEVQDDIPVAATLVDGDTQLQVHAFAAPKSSGLWNEVRAEIAESLGGATGGATEAEGTFGPELVAALQGEDGSSVPARFIGVDGPRWFLRGLMTGPGSTDPMQAQRLLEAFRLVVVNRGTDAMAPRDMLPLHLPREALDGMPHDHDHDHDGHDHHDHDGHDHDTAPEHTFQLPERGPEITEIQ